MAATVDIFPLTVKCTQPPFRDTNMLDLLTKVTCY